MKSEKAKRLLNNGRFHVFCLKGEYPEQRFSPEGKYIEYAQGAPAVKLAEQEAEEQMREKAIEAFKFACTDNYGGECWANDDHHIKCSGKCAKMNDFIKKLNEV